MSEYVGFDCSEMGIVGLLFARAETYPLVVLFLLSADTGLTTDQFIPSSPHLCSIQILSRNCRPVCLDLKLYLKLFRFYPTCLIYVCPQAVRWQSRHAQRVVAYVMNYINVDWMTLNVVLRMSNGQALEFCRQISRTIRKPSLNKT
jgi:hypothetical protein